MANKIWCLFSIENNYDQPEHNLVCWWKDHPSIEQVAKGLGLSFPHKEDNITLNIIKIWQGERLQIANGDTCYHIKEVSEAFNL